MKNLLMVFTLLSGLAFGNAQAAVLQINASGILTGATDVEVGDQIYNVSFTDGSCISLFNGCNVSSFAFNTYAAARLASQALVNQVFLDGPQGMFDSNPTLTSGCSYYYYCDVLTAYDVTYASYADNYFSSGFDSYSQIFRPSIDSTFAWADGYDFVTNAVWSWQRSIPAAVIAPVVSPVPEPSTYAMLLAGFSLLGFTARRRKNNVA